MIKILLIDDEPNVIQGWRMRLALEDDLAVIGEASDPETAPVMAQATQPDVILLDLMLTGRNGAELIPHLFKAAPGCRVIVVSIYDNAGSRYLAFQAGASAFVAKQESPEMLLTAIRAVMK
ncbi:MAG: response regulator transcription factor [Anaerolineae bacterium]|nr:response regulator transcription factor [Anaerolineae bacterium]